jgi:hypothetical protein
VDFDFVQAFSASNHEFSWSLMWFVLSAGVSFSAVLKLKMGVDDRPDDGGSKYL